MAQQRVSAFGFQVGQTQDADAERILRTNKETHHNGMHMKFKSKKARNKIDSSAASA